MQPLEEQEDPSFASVVEIPHLQRPHCDQCRVAIADYECQRCVQRFCKPCELVIHHRLQALALKHEESKGDGRPHQEFLKLISACQECGQNSIEFFCLNCNMYQCEKCCAAKQTQVEPHFFFCVEGSSARMLPFASWGMELTEMVKMSMGELQDRAAAAELAAESADTAAKEVPEEKVSAATAARIKLEQAVGSTSATAAALGNLSLDPEHASERSQAKHATRANTTSIVDLTLDDESDSHTSTSSVSSRPSSQPHVKAEFRVKTESAWLDSATAAQENPVFDVDALMEKTMGDEEDPVLRTLIGEYNQMSAKIFDLDQEMENARNTEKELSRAKPLDLLAVRKAGALKKKISKDKAEAETLRDGVVANLVVNIKADSDELKAFLETCTADVAHARTTCHRNCAALEASIRSQLENIQRIQREMEELISLKKDAFAEVTRLGGEIAQREEEVRKLDKERLEEFLKICQFSKAIQTAVQAMVADLQ